MSDDRWARRVARERASRKEAERLLEAKSLELYEANQHLGAKLRHISLMLDGAPHGMLMIERDLTVGAAFSASLPALFKRPAEQIGGAPAIPLLIDAFGLEADTAAIVDQTLSILVGADALNWDLNHEHLPSEVAPNCGCEKLLEVFWTPMIDERDVVTAILVSMRDVTRERAMATQLAAYEQANNRLLRAIEQLIRAPRAQLCAFFKEADRRAQRIEAALADPLRFREELQIDAHSFKGAARTLGFKELASAVHLFEDRLPPSEHEPADLDEAWRAVEQAYDDLRAAFYDALQSNEAAPRRIGAILEPHFEAAEQALAAEKIPVRVCVEDAVGRAPPGMAEICAEVLPHLIANMVDHSILTAARTGALGDAGALLHASFARTAAGEVALTLSDNGRGFDIPAIERRAAQLGLTADPADSLALIFEPGFSTASEVSERSGRGVGMAAVKRALEAAGGAVAAANDANRGSRIVITLPA